MPLAHLYLANGFEEVEMITVADVLRRAGILVQLVSLTETRMVCGAHDIVVEADIPFSAADELADIVILPGGGLGTQELKASVALAQRLQSHHSAQKRIAAICAAPTVLAAAGLLHGRNACCFPGCETELVAGGAQITAYNVVTDGLITTSRGAGTAASFALELVRLLVGEGKAVAIGRTMLFI